jgi:hypothetical protein
MALGLLKATAGTGSGIFVVNLFFFHMSIELPESLNVSM